MMDDYGTEFCCDEVAALRNHIEALHDIHQERIEKYEAEIARLEDIIAQMSGELVDAWEACEDEDDTRYQTLTIVQPPGRQYLSTLNGCRVYLNGKELRVSNVEIRAGYDRFTTAVITLPVYVEWNEYEIFDSVDDLLAALGEEEE